MNTSWTKIVSIPQGSTSTSIKNKYFSEEGLESDYYFNNVYFNHLIWTGKLYCSSASECLNYVNIIKTPRTA